MIQAAEANSHLKPVFSVLRNHSILRPTTLAGAISCSDCGERCAVTFITDESKNKGKHGFIHCRNCGITEIPMDSLNRWEIDTAAFLTVAFSNITLSVAERVPGQLWQVGKANWAGRSRDVWFARAYRHSEALASLSELNRRPKTIVFAPTEIGAARWQEAAKTLALVLSLESTLSFDDGRIDFDSEYVESRITDAGLGSASTTKRKPGKRRGIRLEKVERLTKEMIVVLRAARDYAFSKKELTGEPELLPRPSQKELGERVGLTESDVSRCLDDPSARELRIYWTIADDLDEIMRWEGPVKKGRKK